MNWKAVVYDATDSEEHVIYKLDEIFYHKKSKFQDIVVGSVGKFGRVLILDGAVQLFEMDECVYHEHLVWPALLYHPNPERVIVLGGGDGLALREVLKDSRVKEAVLCELDQGVIDACKENMADMIDGAFDNPRSTIVVDDALQYLRGNVGKFDVIIVDLVDPYGAEGANLYKECFNLLRPVMKKDSIVVTHGESAGPPRNLALRVAAIASKHFPYVEFYRAFVDSFTLQWGFMLMSDKREFTNVPMEVINERLKGFTSQPRALVPEAIPTCHILPRMLQEKLDEFKAMPEVTFFDTPEIFWYEGKEIPEIFK